MGFSHRFVMAVLVEGVPQKELANGECHIPFGKYSLRLRNRNDRDAAVKIFIDGENVSGSGYRVPANDKIDIHRHSSKDAGFNFVDLDSAEAIEHGKSGPNPDKQKGMVEARFYLAKRPPPQPRVEHHYYPYTVDPYHPRVPFGPYRPYWGGGYSINSGGYSSNSTFHGAPGPECLNLDERDYEQHMASCHATKSVLTLPTGSMRDYTASCHATASVPTGVVADPSVVAVSVGAHPVLHDGATVEGCATGQHFHGVYMDLETDYVPIKLFLRGFVPMGTAYAAKVHDHSSSGSRSSGARQSFCEGCGAGLGKDANFCGGCGRKLG